MANAHHPKRGKATYLLDPSRLLISIATRPLCPYSYSHHFSNAFDFHTDETSYSKHSITLLTASCTILYIVVASCFLRLKPKTLNLNSMLVGSSAHALLLIECFYLMHLP